MSRAAVARALAPYPYALIALRRREGRRALAAARAMRRVVELRGFNLSEPIREAMKDARRAFAGAAALLLLWRTAP